jgi:hypothetical protein
MVAVTLAGCGDKDKVDFECDEENPCGWGAQCVDGFCEAGHCSSSEQCPMEMHCANRQCVPGCELDDDCFPGFECNVELTTCEEEACQETAVDCGYREFCNQASGDCYDAGGQYCKPCDTNNQVEDCGEDNYCLAGYCGVDCSDGEECPSGFECYPFGDSFGNIITYQCFTYCWLYEDYEPGSFVMTPTEEGVIPLDVCIQEFDEPVTEGA